MFLRLSPCRLFSCLVLLIIACLGAVAPQVALAGGTTEKAFFPIIGGDDVTILNFTAERGMSMDIANNGDIYVALAYASDTTLSSLVVMRSVDGGQHWSNWGEVSREVTGESYKDPSLVVVEGDVSRCYLAYAVAPVVFDRREIRVVQADLGASAMSFASPTVVHSQAGEWGVFPDLASDVDNFSTFYLYLTYGVGTTSNSLGEDIRFTRSTNFGSGFEAPYILATATAPAAVTKPHVVYGFGDLLHLSWKYNVDFGATASGIQYRRASSVAGAGLAAWSPMQDLSSLTTGSDGVGGGILDASPVDNTVAISFMRSFPTGGAETGVLLSTNQGFSFVKQSNSSGWFGNTTGVARNPGTGTWTMGNATSTGPIVSTSAAGDLTSWSPWETVDANNNAALLTHMDFAFDPSRGYRTAVIWNDFVGGAATAQLVFDAEWRRDPGYPTTLFGFPLPLTAAPKSAPALVDLNGNGWREIVFTDTADRIQAIEPNGDSFPGFPIVMQEALSTAPVAVGDLNGDGKMEVVVGTNSGRVYGFTAGGTGDYWIHDTQSGQPAYPSIGHLAPPHAQVVAVASGQVVQFLTGAGNLAYDGATPIFAGVLDRAPVFGDVDGDGVPEIVVTSGGRLWNWNLMGTGFDVTLSGAPAITGAVSLGDLDGDGDQEIVVPTENGALYVLQGDGSLEPGWPVAVGSSGALTSAAIGQLLGNGLPEIAVASRNSLVDVRLGNGVEGVGWPQATGAGWFLTGMPLIGLLTGPSPDVVIGSRDKSGWAWDNFGTNIDGWPVPIGEPINMTGALGDLNHDGSQELVLLTDTKLLVFDLHQSAGANISWPMAGHDPGRSGCADCAFDLVSAVGDGTGLGTRVSLAAPLPNPSYGSSLFSFVIPERAVVTLEVFDVRGHLVRLIRQTELPAGSHVLSWDGNDSGGRPAGSGTYIAALRVRGGGRDDRVQRKITLLR